MAGILPVASLGEKRADPIARYLNKRPIMGTYFDVA
jgi:hypothetical protein